MSVNLPTGENNTGSNDWSDVYSNDKALKEAVETLQGEVTTLKAESPVTWYTPRVIATEQGTESSSFATLATPDEIAGVVVAENGLVRIGYRGLVKYSTGEPAAQIALFIGNNQLKLNTSVQAAEVGPGGAFALLGTVPHGLATASGSGPDSTTGQALALSSSLGGECVVFGLPAGTYTVSVKFKTSGTGKISAKARTLWVSTLG